MKLISSFISNIKSNKCSLCTRLLGPGKNCAFTSAKKKWNHYIFKQRASTFLNQITLLNLTTRKRVCMQAVKQPVSGKASKTEQQSCSFFQMNNITQQLLQVRIACPQNGIYMKIDGKYPKWKGRTFLLLQFCQEVFRFSLTEVPLLSGRLD